MTAALTLFAQTGETTRELPAPPIALGAGAFGILVLLLLITMQFNRHR